jgi:hypothetical protein
MRTCSHEGCDKPVHARSMCPRHYSKWVRSTSVKRTHNDGLMADVLKALPGTVPEIAAKVGCSNVTAHRWVTSLHGTKTYVCDWRPAKGPSIPVWAKGRQEDVPCTVKKLTRTEIARAYRDRLKERLANVPKPQTWFSALGAA